jgi:hypothetical protein
LKKNLYLFQPQYSVDFGTEKNYWLPYSIGCIWSYAVQFQDIAYNVECKDIFFKRDSHDQILSKIQEPDVCAFSCYQWNKNYNLKIAKRIKEQHPRCLIVFGGPEVNNEFLNYPQIDSIILGEGENSFLELLRSFIAGQDILKIYYKSRVNNLSMLPSPYATGIFDKLIADNPEVKWATTLETNRGCPFSCTFCDWGSLTYSKIKKFELSRVAHDIDWIANNPIKYIFCADANFGIFKERDLIIAKMIRCAGDRSQNLEAFNATFNKNNNEWSFKILRELGDLNRGFTVSVQSLNPDTLKAVRRDNLGINDLKHIFELCQENNVNSYTELILGLPHETKQSFIDGLCKLLELGQHNHIEIWFTDLLINSELATAESQTKYKIKTVTTGNYLTLNSDNDLYREDIQVVCETSSMSTTDMIESFMYGWIIVNFHMQGYTQMTSRYYNQTLGIDFKTFYNELIKNLHQNPILFDIYNKVKNKLTIFLHQGTLPKNLSGHNLIFSNAYELYVNKKQIFDLLDDIAKQLAGNQYNRDLAILQSHAIFDVDKTYPISIVTDLDAFGRGIGKKYTYTVDSKTSNDIANNFNNLYYVLRRKGFLKNKITLE